MKILNCLNKKTIIEKLLYQAHKIKIWYDEPFRYLRITDLESILSGTYSIDSKNMYVVITEGSVKEFDKGNRESHRHYIMISIT